MGRLRVGQAIEKFDWRGFAKEGDQNLKSRASKGA
jgi:hypothetical protein